MTVIPVISTRPTSMPRRRRGLFAAGAAAIVLALAACDGGGSSSAKSGSPSSGGSSTAASAVAYSACVRSHGVPHFPDPSGSVAVVKADPQQLGVSATQLQTAQQACRTLIPPSGDTAEQQQETRCAEQGDCSQAVVQQWMSGLRTLAQCLRTHGEPNWPDPVVTSVAGHPPAPHFPLDQAGIDHHSQHVLDEVNQCIQLTGFQGLPLP